MVLLIVNFDHHLMDLSAEILRNVYEREEIGSKGQKAVKTMSNLGQGKFTEVKSSQIPQIMQVREDDQDESGWVIKTTIFHIKTSPPPRCKLGRSCWLELF